VGAPSKGSVFLVPFPFSDLSLWQANFRPAVVLAAAGKGDWVLCQVTSKAYGDEKAIRIGADDFESGSLRLESFARPGKLFTAHESLFQEEANRLHATAVERVRSGVLAVF
jgi:mRNA interferase MazF